MKEPEFGYLSSDINHLTSIPILVIIPLLMLSVVYYWFRKEIKSIKEKDHSKWDLLPARLILYFVTLISVFAVSMYPSMILRGPKCKSFIQPKKFQTTVPSYPNPHNPPKIFYDVLPQHPLELPWCPKDREAVEKHYECCVTEYKKKQYKQHLTFIESSIG